MCKWNRLQNNYSNKNFHNFHRNLKINSGIHRLRSNFTFIGQNLVYIRRSLQQMYNFSMKFHKSNIIDSINSILGDNLYTKYLVRYNLNTVRRNFCILRQKDLGILLVNKLPKYLKKIFLPLNRTYFHSNSSLGCILNIPNGKDRNIDNI